MAARSIELRQQCIDSLTPHQRAMWRMRYVAETGRELSIYPRRDWPSKLCQAALHEPDSYDGRGDIDWNGDVEPAKPAGVRVEIDEADCAEIVDDVVAALGGEDDTDYHEDGAEPMTPQAPTRKPAAKPSLPVESAQGRQVKRDAAENLAKALDTLLGSVQTQVDPAQVKQIAVDTFGELGESLAERICADVNKSLEQSVMETIQKHGTLRLEIKQIESGVVKKIDSPHELLARLIPYANARANLLLVGPSGCGKTHLARQLAEALSLRFGMQSLSGATSEGTLLGRVDQFHGHIYKPSQYVDFYENGGLFLVDEIDASDPNVLVALNASLANGHIAVPCSEKPIRTRHKDFVCIAAANTFGHGADRMYVGRNQLDAATLDRFRSATFNMDYDHKLEHAIGQADIVKFAHQVRAKVKDLKLRRIVSTRWIVDATRLLSLGGVKLKDLIDGFFCDWPSEERLKVVDPSDIPF